jgi:hypothetical protein
MALLSLGLRWAGEGLAGAEGTESRSADVLPPGARIDRQGPRRASEAGDR